MKRIPRIFWLLLIAGIALRLLAIFLREPGVLERAPDEDEYYLIARVSLAGDGFALRGVTTGYRNVMLPVLTAGTILLFGKSPKPMLFLNVILSCVSAYFLYLLGRRRFRKSRARHGRSLALLSRRDSILRDVVHRNAVRVLVAAGFGAL